MAVGRWEEEVEEAFDEVGMALKTFKWARGGGVPGPDGFVPAGCVEGWGGAGGYGGGGRGGGRKSERGEGSGGTAIGVCDLTGLFGGCVLVASIDCDWW